MMYLQLTGGNDSATEDLCRLHGLQIIDKLVLVDIGLYNGYDVKSLISYE